MEKRIHCNYEIIVSCAINDIEIVIGHNCNPKAPSPYVCWYCRNKTDYFWGQVINEWFQEQQLDRTLFVSKFRDQVTGRPMYDIAFQYDPFWEGKVKY